MAFDDIAKRMQKRDAFVFGRRRLMADLANATPTSSRRGVVGAYIVMSVGLLLVIAGFIAFLVALTRAPAAEVRLLRWSIGLGVVLMIRAWRMLPDQPNQ